MSQSANPTPCHYFVDETGDGVLFDRRKRVVVGKEGCSRYFALGAIEVTDPRALDRDLTALREELLADSYFAGVPSMQPERRKTAIAFHAKDDCAEVRREVFHRLMKHELRFFAVLRDKQVIADLVRQENVRKPKYKYHPNQLYDRCVDQLFRERLHKEESYVIQFARRGRRDRTESLENAIRQAKAAFRNKWGKDSVAPIEIAAANSADVAGLQAVDYFLWALQRLYVRQEARYWDFVAPKASLVLDYDDTSSSGAGTYYTKKAPLSLEGLKGREPGI